MSEPGFASLGPTLLARKGGAKPAMRPQLAPLVADEAEIAALADEQLEDLGWNDMGDGSGGDSPEDESASDNGADVVPISAAVAADAAGAHNPIVVRQQRRLEERVLADAVMTGPEEENGQMVEEFEEEYDEEGEEEAGYDYAVAPEEPAAPVAKKASARTAVQAPLAPARSTVFPAARNAERRAAFTLRLDPERHLKLRLAATMQGVSAQALLTEALDAMLAEFDDLDVIAAHLKRH
jgi:hypothetical protein